VNVTLYDGADFIAVESQDREEKEKTTSQSNRDLNNYIEVKISRVKMVYEKYHVVDYAESGTSCPYAKASTKYFTSKRNEFRPLSRMRLSIHDVEILDRVKSSQWDRMLVRDEERLLNQQLARPFIYSSGKIIPVFYASLDHFMPGENFPKGYELDVKILPLRLNLDYDSILLLLSGFAYFLDDGKEDKRPLGPPIPRDETDYDRNHSSSSSYDVIRTVPIAPPPPPQRSDSQDGVYFRNISISAIEIGFSTNAKSSTKEPSTEKLKSILRAFNVVSLTDALIVLDQVYLTGMLRVFYEEVHILTPFSFQMLLVSAVYNFVCLSIICLEIQKRRLDELSGFYLRFTYNTNRQLQILRGPLGSLDPIRPFVNIFSQFFLLSYILMYNRRYSLVTILNQLFEFNPILCRDSARSMSSFGTTLLTEFLDFSSRITAGGQATFEAVDQFVDPSSSSEGQNLSRQRIQPLNTAEGIQYSWQALFHELSRASSALTAPIGEYQQSGLMSAIYSSFKSVPIATVRPMIGIAGGLSLIFQGMRNHLHDPNIVRRRRIRYKQK
jgi:hypothetical protein